MYSKELPKIVVIVGPTASGKSDLAMHVAKTHGGELICADSRTVYKGMDIGTAKPSQQDRSRIPHYLLDVVEPNERFTAAEFKQRALHSINYINAKGKLPVIVGGTGLYIDSVIFDYNFGPNAGKQQREELESKSTDELQVICIENNIDLPENNQNRRHLIRAIELGGQVRQNKRLRPHTLVVGIDMPKELLRQRITKRAHEMFDGGVIPETKALAGKYGWDSEAMTGNIYRIVKRLLEGEIDRPTAVELFINSDMSLVKRQRTWFRRNPYIVWGSPDKLQEVIADFVARPIS